VLETKEVQMRIDPSRQPELAAVMCGGVEKLMARGVGRRAAVRRIARKHALNPRSVSAMIVRVDDAEGGLL
jgi:hypothetical protein